MTLFYSFFFVTQNKIAMKMSMLDYCKVILEKVHFDQTLFHKEYRKSMRWLSHEERKHLQEWKAQRFGTSAMTLSS